VQFDELEHVLAARGRDVGRMRVAAARSGIVVGFPKDPLIHVSWWVLAAAGVLAAVRRRRRRT
jgi:MYXO-CTERM domain-containing protein